MKNNVAFKILVAMKNPENINMGYFREIKVSNLS
jgi:hypothetical protein